MKAYPVLDVRGESTDLLLALVDDCAPTAIEERGDSVRVFFPTPETRDAACAALTQRFDVTTLDVPDDNWAQRSQDSLRPISVGRITVAPPWSIVSPQPSTIPSAISPQPSAITIVVLPSMGFGTGHHATTRLCLSALQSIDLADRVLLDVGTGSGVLALAAARLGAARAVGIDVDPDAIQSAHENLGLNPAVRHVRFEVADLASARLPRAQVLTANLTGALLVGSAPSLFAAVDTGGVLILSGLLANERDEVCRAFLPATVCWEREEDGWVGLAMKKA